MDGIEKFNSWGIKFTKPDVAAPVLPADITSLGSEDLGELFTHLTAWTDYLNSQVTFAQLDERRVLKEKDRLENMLMLKRMGSQAKGERVTAIKVEIANNQDLLDLDIEYEEKYAYRKLLEMMLTNHERDLALVSREITRRTNERFRRD
jgi:hypothetical protein